jgi:thiol-disulfide isomerase/thioredoxin
MAIASRMLPLGTPLPNVALLDVHDVERTLVDIADGRPLLVCFVCNHCPYVQHIEHGIAAVAQDYPDIAVVAICSNDAAAYPDDDIPGLLDQISRTGWTFPYLVDTDQSVAHIFQAACTPDFYLFDASGVLVYRGAFDDARPKQPTEVTGRDIRAALDAITSGRDISREQRPSMGCGIKWKPGNEPNVDGPG